MALKRKLSKSDYDALPEAVKVEYKENGGSYLLDVDGDSEALEALKRAKDHEVAAANALKAELAALKTEKDKQNRDKGDVAAVEAAYQEKIKALETSWQEKHAKAEEALSGLKKRVSDAAHDSAARTLAGELFKSADPFLPYVKSRLTVEDGADGPVVRVLDKDGKPSAASLSDLKKEILTDKAFSDYVVASKASGGAAGASGRNPSGSGVSGTGQNNFATMKPEQLAAHIAATKQANGG